MGLSVPLNRRPSNDPFECAVRTLYVSRNKGTEDRELAEVLTKINGYKPDTTEYVCYARRQYGYACLANQLVKEQVSTKSSGGRLSYYAVSRHPANVESLHCRAGPASSSGTRFRNSANLPDVIRAPATRGIQRTLAVTDHGDDLYLASMDSVRFESADSDKSEYSCYESAWAV